MLPSFVPAAHELHPIDLDAQDARQILTTLAADATPHVVVECATLQSLRTRGVSHVISQLLILHQAGARVFLRNCPLVLQRCLHLLRLQQLFPLLA